MKKEIEFIKSVISEVEVTQLSNQYYKIFIPGYGTVIFEGADNNTFFIRCRSISAYNYLISKLKLNKNNIKSVTLIASSDSNAIDKINCKDCESTFCPLCNRECKGSSCILYFKSYAENEVVYRREQDERINIIERETNIGVCGLVRLNN